MSIKRVNYTIAEHNDQVILVIDHRTAGLIKRALAIISIPSSAYGENLCRSVAHDLEKTLTR